VGVAREEVVEPVRPGNTAKVDRDDVTTACHPLTLGGAGEGRRRRLRHRERDAVVLAGVHDERRHGDRRQGVTTGRRRRTERAHGAWRKLPVGVARVARDRIVHGCITCATGDVRRDDGPEGRRAPDECHGARRFEIGREEGQGANAILFGGESRRDRAAHRQPDYADPGRAFAEQRELPARDPHVVFRARRGEVAQTTSVPGQERRVHGEAGSVQPATEVAQRLGRVAESMQQQQRATRASVEAEAFGPRHDAGGVRRPLPGIRSFRPTSRTPLQQPGGDGHREQERCEHQLTERTGAVSTGASPSRRRGSIGRCRRRGCGRA
jgi:hypothetical protein